MGVVFVHSAYAPGHPAMMGMSPGVQLAESIVFTLAVGFPVHAFILLSFLHLGPRLQAGVPAGELLRAAARRLLPAHFFWVTMFLGTRALVERSVPGPSEMLTGYVLGTAAAHLYFTPLLLALTALAPLLYRGARAPFTAVLTGGALALGSIALYGLVAPGTEWLTPVVGLMSTSTIAVAGLALAERWGGSAPPSQSAPAILWVAGAGLLASAGVLVQAAAQSGWQPVPFGAGVWLGRLGYSLAVPVLLVAMGGPVPAWVIRLAPYTLGVYFVHPFFTKALQTLEAQVPALAGMEAVLIAPNAVIGIALSLGAVVLLARTPMRRFVI
jgi:hypothetical protein